MNTLRFSLLPSSTSAVIYTIYRRTLLILIYNAYIQYDDFFYLIRNLPNIIEMSGGKASRTEVG